MTAKRMIVRGDVQGVGFRAHVLHAASILGLDGEVWNRKDGAVELIASSEAEGAFESLVARLQKGPGVVESVIVEDTSLTTEPGFRVGPTR